MHFHTDCPRARVRATPCDPIKRYRELELHFYKRDHCHCKPQRRVIRQPCGCATGPGSAVKLRRRCDALRGRLHLEILTRRWSSEANRCVPIRTVKTIPIGEYLPVSVRVSDGVGNWPFQWLIFRTMIVIYVPLSLHHLPCFTKLTDPRFLLLHSQCLVSQLMFFRMYNPHPCYREYWLYADIQVMFTQTDHFIHKTSKSRFHIPFVKPRKLMRLT